MVYPAGSTVHFVAQVENDELTRILGRELVDVGDDIGNHATHAPNRSKDFDCAEMPGVPLAIAMNRADVEPSGTVYELLVYVSGLCLRVVRYSAVGSSDF